MPWSGSAPNQTFSRTDGTRTGSTTWQLAEAASVDIISSDNDTHDQDISDGINSCVKKDGGNAATANLPMGGFGHTNVAVATASTMYARASDVQSNRLSYCTVSGTADAISLTNTLVISAYATGQKFRFQALYTNTGSVTVSVDGLTATAVKSAGTALSAGQIIAGAWVEVAYDGTDFELCNAAGSTPAAVSVGTVMAWPTATIPTGWLECDGSAVSRTTYASLYAVIGTAYGVGDGSTTFNLPDYQGEFLRGHDDGAGVDPDAASRTNRGDGTTGDNVGTKQTYDTKAHSHTATVNDPGHAHDYVRIIDDTPHPTGSGRSDPLTDDTQQTSTEVTGITVDISTYPASGGNKQ